MAFAVRVRLLSIDLIIQHTRVDTEMKTANFRPAAVLRNAVGISVADKIAISSTVSTVHRGDGGGGAEFARCNWLQMLLLTQRCVIGVR